MISTYPAPVLADGVELVVGDEVRSQVLPPEADTLHLVVGVTWTQHPWSARTPLSSYVFL